MLKKLFLSYIIILLVLFTSNFEAEVAFASEPPAPNRSISLDANKPATAGLTAHLSGNGSAERVATYTSENEVVSLDERISVDWDEDQNPATHVWVSGNNFGPSYNFSGDEFGLYAFYSTGPWNTLHTYPSAGTYTAFARIHHGAPGDPQDVGGDDDYDQIEIPITVAEGVYNMPGNYSVNVSPAPTVNELTVEAGGVAVGAPYVGTEEEQAVFVDWDNDQNLSTSNWVSITNLTKSFATSPLWGPLLQGIWSDSHTYAGDGTYNVRVRVHHGNIDGPNITDTGTITFQIVIDAGVVVPPPAENTAILCSDGIDNDGDTNIDLLDLDCHPFKPKLTVTKVVINDDAGTKEVSDFPLFATLDLAVTSLTSGIASILNNPGTYAVSETNSEGYEASFSGDCDASGMITLAIGDNKFCTITNNDADVIIEEVVGGGGGGGSSGSKKKSPEVPNEEIVPNTPDPLTVGPLVLNVTPTQNRSGAPRIAEDANSAVIEPELETTYENNALEVLDESALPPAPDLSQTAAVVGSGFNISILWIILALLLLALLLVYRRIRKNRESSELEN